MRVGVFDSAGTPPNWRCVRACGSPPDRSPLRGRTANIPGTVRAAKRVVRPTPLPKVTYFAAIAIAGAEKISKINSIAIKLTFLLWQLKLF